MQYLLVIKQAIYTYPLILAIAIIPFIVYELKEGKRLNVINTFTYSIFILYLVCIYFLVILPLPENPENFELSKLIDHLQLMPFMFIIDITKDLMIDLTNPITILNIFRQDASIQTLFNVVMFIPLGIFLKYWLNIDLKKILLIGFCVSLFLELTQLTGLYGIYSPYRLFDIDDLMVNTLGVFIGYLASNTINAHLISYEKLEVSLSKEKYQKGLLTNL